jgi:hypothetical protein
MPALLRRRRAQWMSRLAVAPTLPNTLTLPGHAFDIHEHGGRLDAVGRQRAISGIGLAINSVRRPIGSSVFGLTLESRTRSRTQTPCGGG